MTPVIIRLKGFPRGVIVEEQRVYYAKDPRHCNEKWVRVLHDSGKRVWYPNSLVMRTHPPNTLTSRKSPKSSAGA